ncbi:MAG: hypothetical protein BGO50_14180 [Rhodanobacter sp. 67-28]|nr:MAG: hypothetical protein BGO50_14180 [Rhodanobacter sp. 67-28]
MRFYLLALLVGVIAGLTFLKVVVPHVQHDVTSRKCHVVTGLAQYARGNADQIDAAVNAAVLGNQPAPATSCD